MVHSAYGYQEEDQASQKEDRADEKAGEQTSGNERYFKEGSHQDEDCRQKKGEQEIRRPAKSNSAKKADTRAEPDRGHRGF